MVKFSDLAAAGLKKATDDAEQLAALRHSIILHLSHPDAPEKSHKLSGPVSKQVYMFALWKIRITWELTATGDIVVWSVGLLRAHR